MNYGERIDVQYQVLDQYMKPLQMAGLVPYEKGTFFTGGNFDQQLGARQPLMGPSTTTLLVCVLVFLF